MESLLPGLREELELDLVVANGENAAEGAGITGRLADRLLAAGVDCITLGNHTWRQRDIAEYLLREPRMIRPANYLDSAPGRGLTAVEATDGTPVAVLNLLGRLYLEPARSPFEVADAPGRGGAAAAPRGARRHARRGHQREGRHGPATWRVR